MKKPAVVGIVLLAGFILSSIPGARAADAEKQVRELISRWEKAFRAKDTDAVMAVYAPGDQLIAFDIVPPLACVGHDAYRKNYEAFFAMYEGPLDTEIRDLKVAASGDVAFITCLERLSGTVKGGQKLTQWVRVTSGLRKIGGHWLIVHDHISVPVDFEHGKALTDLVP